MFQLVENGKVVREKMRSKVCLIELRRWKSNRQMDVRYRNTGELPGCWFPKPPSRVYPGSRWYRLSDSRNEELVLLTREPWGRGPSSLGAVDLWWSCSRG